VHKILKDVNMNTLLDWDKVKTKSVARYRQFK